MAREVKRGNRPATASFDVGDAPKVKVAVSDIDGILRGKYLHRDKFASAAEGGFDPSPYHGTLANGGSGLSDFHDFDALVSEQTKADLAQVRDGLLDGSVTPPAAG